MSIPLLSANRFRPKRAGLETGAIQFMEIDSQTEFPPGFPIPSPCVQICRLNAQQVCVGCGRSVREVAEWSSMSREEKIAALESSRRRLNSLQS
jgi:hypothetical protein